MPNLNQVLQSRRARIAIQLSGLGLNVVAVVVAAVAHETAAVTSVALVGVSALLALKFGLVAIVQITHASKRIDSHVATTLDNSLRDLQSQLARAVRLSTLIESRLDALERSRRDEDIFDLRAEQLIAQVATMQFEMARLDERLDAIEQQFG